jgi:predicted enzyme related to lactoylglutathione lyase
MPNPVVHFEVYGKNLPKLKKFYAKAFGWKTNAYGSDYAMVKSGGKGGIAGGIGKGKKAVLFYIRVKSLEKALEAAKKAGGKPKQKPFELPGAGISIATFVDPAGNEIGLVA